jgi:hypothetical protein
MRLKRRFLSIGAAVLIAGASALVVATPAQASAHGCNAAGDAATCINVTGSGLYVDKAYVQYGHAINIFATVCSPEYYMKAYPQNAGGYVWQYSSIAGCWDQYAPAAYWSWQTSSHYFVNGSQFCGESRNDNTNYRWDSWACINIHS